MAIPPIWIFLIIAVVLVYILSILFRNQSTIFLIEIVRDRMFYVLAVALIVFVGFSLFSIFSNNAVDFTSIDGVKQAAKLMWLWVKSLFFNIVNITGYTGQQDWALTNGTG